MNTIYIYIYIYIYNFSSNDVTEWYNSALKTWSFSYLQNLTLHWCRLRWHIFQIWSGPPILLVEGNPQLCLIFFFLVLLLVMFSLHFKIFWCLLFNILFVFLNLPCVLLFDVSGFFGFFWCLAFLCIMFDIFHIFIFSILLYGFFFNVISSLNYLSFLFWIIFLFLAFNPLYYFAGTCSLFNEFLIALLALSVQSTLINCIWNYRVSE